MYCEKLQLIKDDENSPKYLIDDLAIYKLDVFLNYDVTLRERENINPVRLAIERNINYKTALMAFIIGSRKKLFQLRMFYECECDEKIELTSTSEIIKCDCGYIGNYKNSKDKIKLYFRLLEKPVNCNGESVKNGEADYLENSDIEQFDNSFSFVEKVGGSDLVKVINEECLLSIREAQMKDYLGDNHEGV